MSEMVCMKETPRVSVTACVSGMVRVSEARCVSGRACVRSLYVREMTVGMREHAAASPGVSVTPRVSVPAWVSSMVCVKEKVRVS